MSREHIDSTVSLTDYGYALLETNNELLKDIVDLLVKLNAKLPDPEQPVSENDEQA